MALHRGCRRISRCGREISCCHADDNVGIHSVPESFRRGTFSGTLWSRFCPSCRRNWDFAHRRVRVSCVSLKQCKALAWFRDLVFPHRSLRRCLPVNGLCLRFSWWQEGERVEVRASGIQWRRLKRQRSQKYAFWKYRRGTPSDSAWTRVTPGLGDFRAFPTFSRH